MSETESESEQIPLTRTVPADLLRAMAATVGLDLPAERAAALVTQAEPHFALLHALDEIAHPSTEPAAEFHLDAWRSAFDG
jgi:hypothetical protein